MNDVAPLTAKEVNALLPKRWHTEGKTFRDERTPFSLKIEYNAHSAGFYFELIVARRGVFWTAWRD